MRGLILASNIAGVLVVYGPLGWGRLSEVMRIPLIDYAPVFALAGMIGLMRLLGATAGWVTAFPQIVPDGVERGDCIVCCPRRVCRCDTSGVPVA